MYIVYMYYEEPNTFKSYSSFLTNRVILLLKCGFVNLEFNLEYFNHRLPHFEFGLIDCKTCWGIIMLNNQNPLINTIVQENLIPKKSEIIPEI